MLKIFKLLNKAQSEIDNTAVIIALPCWLLYELHFNFLLMSFVCPYKIPSLIYLQKVFSMTAVNTHNYYNINGFLSVRNYPL